MTKKPLVRQILGEAVDVPAPDAVEQDRVAGGAEKPGLTPGESIPVETLLASWEKGEKQEVAIRVLDALDSYQQFVELCFRIGQQGAMELGGIMDELTSEEKSPHEYDTVPGEELGSKYMPGKGPRPGIDTHRATGMGDSLTQRILGRK